MNIKKNDDKKYNINLLINNFDNTLLFENMHLAQEELEYYYKKNLLYKKKLNEYKNNNNIFFKEKLIEIISENIKLNYLIKNQKIILENELKNNIKIRLGDTLIEGISSFNSFVKLPFKLLKIWKSLIQKKPPKTLGESDFSKVISTFNQYGYDKTEKLLNSIYISPIMRANAYTALAKHLIKINKEKAIIYARLAYETDPCFYRLKWLAYRLYDINDILNAETLLELLPSDIKLNTSEKIKINKIKELSKTYRINQANNILKKIQ